MKNHQTRSDVVPDRLAEAACYAVLRRIAPVLRHDVAGFLQPVGMLMTVLQRRVQMLLTKLEKSQLAPDQLRALRGFEILERIGGNDATGLFEAHARQPIGRMGREAQACLERLSARR